MDTSMLYETCDIVTRSTTLSGGLESFVETTLYSWIKCYVKISTGDTGVSSSEKANTETVYVILDRSVTVPLGAVVTVNGNKYEVVEVKAYKMIEEGNVKLKCTKL